MKYTVESAEPRIVKFKDGSDKTKYVCTLVDEAKVATDLVEVWPGRDGAVRVGSTLDGDIEDGTYGKKFKRAAMGFGSPKRDYAKEDAERSKRIAFLASTERGREISSDAATLALSTVKMMLDRRAHDDKSPITKDQVRASLVDWKAWWTKELSASIPEERDWFISEYNKYDK